MCATPDAAIADDLDLAADREGPAGTIAFAYGRDKLGPNEATSAFLVFRKGGLE
jgi:conjugal transfer pilus assembly protein TraK